MSFDLNGKTIWIAGETGMVGRALTRALKTRHVTLLTAPHGVLDITDQAATFDWLRHHKPDLIFMAAAKVGGIGANLAHPADFIRDNLAIAQNVIEGAHRSDVNRLIYLGSSCIYPRLAEQPINEESLLTGPLEPTNEWYAIAKIAGLKLCQAYRRQYGRSYCSAMPTNLYGPYDTFDEEVSHVIPAMILKFHRAKLAGAGHVELWGTGQPLREFLHVDDLADALILMAERYDGESPLNIGSGEEISIADLAALVREVVGYEGDIVFNPQKPDGTPRKLLNSSRANALGWRKRMDLKSGLVDVYETWLGAA